MIDAISTAVSGLRSSSAQFEKAAQRVTQATVPAAGEASASKGMDDLPAAIVDSKISALSFKANAAVLKTADKMVGTLFDTLA